MTIEHSMFTVEGLDIAAMLLAEGKKNLYIKKQLDKYHYFIHHLIEKTKYNRLKEGTYVRTSFTILVSLCGARYTQDILAYLKKWGIIEPNGKWKNGEQCQGYRLKTEYRKRKVVRVGFSNINFMDKLNSDRKKKLNDLNGINKFLLLHLNDLIIDHERAFKYLKERTSKCIDINTVSPSPPYVYTPLQTILNPFNETTAFHEQSINDFMHGLFKLIEDEYGRVHTNLTNLPSELRQFIFHKVNPNATLVNIDIVNSQPFFLACLLLKHYERSKQQMEEDVTNYISLCLEGEIYEHLMKHSNGLSRPEVKDGLFSVYYNRNTSNPTILGKTFEKLFPNVSAYIRLQKKTNYRHFSWKMQKEESGMIIGKIVNRIRSFHNDKIFVGTIHDSLICFKHDQPMIEKIILDEISKKYNVVPTLKDEVFSKGCQNPEKFDMRQSLLLLQTDLLGQVA